MDHSKHDHPKHALSGALSAALVLALYCPGRAVAQEPIFYPSKQQSAELQARDKGECQVWARQTTGIDPVAVAQTPSAPVPTGPAVGGGERVAGAAKGAIVGEIAGDHGGEGAAIGAMVGGSRARRNRASQQQAAQQNSDAARSSQMATYNRAVSACMEGRGYSVK